MQRKLKMIICLLGLIAYPNIHAEPEVLADYGGRETGLKSPQEQIRELANRMPVPQAPAENGLLQRFPIESDLSVGVIENRQHDKPVSRPFFIVGYDEHSARWLGTNLNYLQEINALGLVTNVRSASELARLQQYAGTIELQAMPVESIAEQFDVDSYPVLITTEEITQ